MYVSVVNIHRTDEHGVFDEEDDLLDSINVLTILTPENITETDILDEVIENNPEGTHLHIEVFILNYIHFIDETDEEEVEAFLESLVENLSEMIEDESLLLLDDFTIRTVIQRDSEDF